MQTNLNVLDMKFVFTFFTFYFFATMMNAQVPCGAVLFDNFNEGISTDWNIIQSLENITNDGGQLTLSYAADTPGINRSFNDRTGEISLAFT